MQGSAIPREQLAATEAEIRRLQAVVGELREREGIARQNSELLKKIVDLLPVSLTVQDEDGQVCPGQ